VPIELPAAWVVVLNVGGWLVLQLTLAWAFTRMPVEWFQPAPPRAWENDGRFYERFVAIRRWKDLLPDGARWFAGGFAKGALTSVNPEYLQRFVRETRRGELCHWFAIFGVPIFFLWNRGGETSSSSPMPWPPTCHASSLSDTTAHACFG